MSLRLFFRRLDRWRRSSRGGLLPQLLWLLGSDQHLLPHRLPPAEVRRILVVRNNKRIGNMYFLLPFLHALRQAYPQAVIDLMVINLHHRPIFEHMGLDRIWVSSFTFGGIGAFLQCIRSARQTPYDLLLMPYRSETDVLIGSLLYARNKVALEDHRNHGAYPHALPAPVTSPHAALHPLALLTAMGHPVQEPARHHMVLSDAETAAGAAVVQQLTGDGERCFAYFRGARGSKVIADVEWLRILQDFERASEQSIHWVEILSPDVQTPLRAGTSTFATPDFRHLAAVLKAMDLFICSDTGPLHLADAAGARCVGLYNATDPQQFGCLGTDTVNVLFPHQFSAENVLARLRMA